MNIVSAFSLTIVAICRHIITKLCGIISLCRSSKYRYSERKFFERDKMEIK